MRHSPKSKSVKVWGTYTKSLRRTQYMSLLNSLTTQRTARRLSEKVWGGIGHQYDRLTHQEFKCSYRKNKQPASSWNTGPSSAGARRAKTTIYDTWGRHNKRIWGLDGIVQIAERVLKAKEFDIVASLQKKSSVKPELKRRKPMSKNKTLLVAKSTKNDEFKTHVQTLGGTRWFAK